MRCNKQCAHIYEKGFSGNNWILNLILPIYVYSVIGPLCSLKEIDFFFSISNRRCMKYFLFIIFWSELHVYQ